jgi:hypothetical protein
MMGLVLYVLKTEVSKLTPSNVQLGQLCEGILDMGDRFIYLPLEGKLADVLSLFTQHHIDYHLASEEKVVEGLIF